MTLSAHIDDFLKYLGSDNKTSKLTVKNYDHYLKRFLFFSGDIEITSLTPKILIDYQVYLSTYEDSQTKKPLKKVTQNFFLIALRSFLRYLTKINIISLPIDSIKLFEAEKPLLKTLESTDLKRLLDAPDASKIEGIRDRSILETLFSSGLLVSELASLNRDTIDLYLRQFKIKGKGGKEREISISPEAASWLERYISLRKDAFKPLFIRFQGKLSEEDGGEKMRLTTRSIERIVEKYVKALNLSIKVTPQILRHSFAAGLIEDGKDIHTVQQILGHNNVSTTQIYAHSISIQNISDLTKTSS